MKSQTDEVREDFLQLWSRLSTFWGIPPSAARVHAWLLSFPEGADAEAISAALGLSRGAVSMACRDLLDWGLVSAGRRSGVRRVVYSAETDFERAIVSIVRSRKRKEWDPLLAGVRDWRGRLEGEVSTDAAHLRELFGEIEGIIRMVEGTARAFLEGFVIRRFGLKTLLRAARGKEHKE